MEKHYVYFIGAVNPNTESLEAIKIGISEDPVKRLQSMTTDNHLPLVLMSTIECTTENTALAVEKRYHDKYKESRIKGEWFSITPNLIKDICQSDQYKRRRPRDISAPEQEILNILDQHGNEMSLSELGRKIRTIPSEERNNILNTLKSKDYISIKEVNTKGRLKKIIKLR